MNLKVVSPADAKEPEAPPVFQPTANLRWVERPSTVQMKLQGAPPRYTTIQQLWVVLGPVMQIPSGQVMQQVERQEWRDLPMHKEDALSPGLFP